MQTNFELKNVTHKISEENKSEYTLKFTDGNLDRTITLTGSGELKDALKI